MASIEEKMDLCSVCERCKGDSGGLSCGHIFCTECFSSFVAGSLEELNTNLRCVICGTISTLVYESMKEKIMFRFGRNHEPKFIQPVAVTTNRNMDFILPDAGQKRILVYDQQGNPKNDFAYVYGTRASGGLAITHQGFMIMPFDNGLHNGLAYYTPDGAYLTTTYMPSGGSIGDVTVNSKDHILVTDPKCAKLYIIKEARQKISSAIVIPQLMGESYQPKPHGIDVDSEDNIMVTDIANHCVKVLNQKGQFLFSFGGIGEQPNQFNKPLGIAVDNNDRIIVADNGNHRVQLFDPEGTFIEYIVRYNYGIDTYMAPIDVVAMGNEQVAVLLKGTKDADAGEVRVYSSDF